MDTENEINELAAQFGSPDKEARRNAAEKLSQMGSPAVLPMINLLDSPEWVVRYRACEVLGHLKSELALNPLTMKLKDEKDHVRYMAAKSLGMYDKSDMISRTISMSLLPILKDENSFVRRSAAASLSIHGTRTAAMALKCAVNNETDEKTKAEMTAAIEKLQQ